MIVFKKDQLPDYPFQTAIKKPLPVKCYQMQEAFRVETLEGVMEGKKGDYLMIGIQGEMYVCDQDIFMDTYDIISESAP